MKKVKCVLSLLTAMLLVVGSIAAVLPLNGNAGKAVPNVVDKKDFSLLSYTGEQASAEALGVYESANVWLGGNRGTVACARGYMGEGYFVQKVEAGAHKAFTEATLDLEYWVCTSGGYVDVYLSTNGVSYNKLIRYNAVNASATQNAALDLTGVAGARTIYVKITMQHWDTWEGAAVKVSTVSGYTEDAPDVVDTTDFSLLSYTGAVASAEALGVCESANVWLGGNHGTVACASGYQGEGYFVKKVSAGEGMQFTDAVLDLNYWICVSGGYVDVYLSNNGVAYEKLARYDSANASAVQSAKVALNAAAGCSEIYVKIAMQHWDTWEGAAVSSFTVSGYTERQPDVVDTTDFSLLSYTGAVASAEALGVCESANVWLGGNHGTVACASGYQGEGYFVKKVSAGEKKYFSSAKLDLDYWVCVSGGYVDVYLSTNGVSYNKLARYDTASAAVQKVTLDLDVGGADTLYVKIAMQHWDTWEGAAVRCITVSGTTAAAPDLVVENDFSLLTFNNDYHPTAAEINVTALDNVRVGGNYGKVVSPSGYAGEGYIVKKIEAAEGKDFRALTLDLWYWLSDTDHSPYVKVLYSADGSAYTQIASYSETDAAAAQHAVLDIPVTDGDTVAYVKIVMQHWGSYEGAAVKSMTFNGFCNGTEEDDPGQDDPGQDDPGQDDPGQDDPSGDVSGLTQVKFYKSFLSLPRGEVTAEEIGAVSEENMMFGCDGQSVLSARNGYEPANAVWLLKAADGETLQNAYLTFTGRTCYNDPNQKNNNRMTFYASTDGVNFTKVTELHSTDNPDFGQTFEINLSSVAKGASEIYVKAEMLVFDSPHIMSMRNLTLVGNRGGKVIGGDEPDDPGQDDPGQDDPGQDDPGQDEPSGDVTGLTQVKFYKSFLSLHKGEVTAEEIGAVSEENMMFGSDDQPVLSARNGFEPANAVWVLEAADGETLQNAYLTFTGRTCYNDPGQKDNNRMTFYASADGVNFTKITELHSTDNPDFGQTFEINLNSVAKGASKIFVKAEMLVFDSPHIMAMRNLTLVGNRGGKVTEEGGQDGKVGTRVQRNIDYSDMLFGEVTAKSIGAVEEKNMMFGCDGVPLLSARNGYEDAYAVWSITAAEGETFRDGEFSFVGRTWWQDAKTKNDNRMNVLVSTDGENFVMVKQFGSTDNDAVDQKYTVDLTEYVQDAAKIFVKVELLVFDSPHIFGMKSVSLVGNIHGRNPVEEGNTGKKDNKSTTTTAKKKRVTTAATVAEEEEEEQVDTLNGKLTKKKATAAATKATVPVGSDGQNGGIPAKTVRIAVIILSALLWGGGITAILLMARKRKA